MVQIWRAFSLPTRVSNRWSEDSINLTRFLRYMHTLPFGRRSFYKIPEVGGAFDRYRRLFGISSFKFGVPLLLRTVFLVSSVKQLSIRFL